MLVAGCAPAAPQTIVPASLTIVPPSYYSAVPRYRILPAKRVRGRAPKIEIEAEDPTQTEILKWYLDYIAGDISKLKKEVEK